ncbi:zinc metallopeptidase [Microcoleus sp. herbarium14]|uniref:zinc metallopeptidase n=1 Tax=Microcoleus sp. herbarium14 TaxID=3055439 RepID=UPI002FCF0395
MASNYSGNNYGSSFDGSPTQLEIDVDRLMPRLHPFRKHILLKERQNKKTGAELARTILHLNGRTDVKVGVNEENQNCYSPLLNAVSLSKDVAGSRSTVAVAIAAHEVAHALQSEFYKKLRRIFSIFTWFPFNFLLVIFELLFLMGNIVILNIQIVPVLLSVSGMTLNNFWYLYYYYRCEEFQHYLKQFQQYLKHFKQFGWAQHSINLVVVLGILGINVWPIIWLISGWPNWGWIIFVMGMGLLTLGINLWGVVWLIWGWPISGWIILCFWLLILLSLFCELMRRCFVFIKEINASLLALRLLKKYKILARRERREARRYLLAAGLTYLTYMKLW